MSVLLIIPFLESLGLGTVVAGGAEVVVGETAGGLVAGAVTGTVGGAIAAPIDEAAKNFYQNSGLEETFNGYFSVANSLWNTDPLLVKKKPKEVKEVKVAPNAPTVSITGLGGTTDQQNYTFSSTGNTNNSLGSIQQIPRNKNNPPSKSKVQTMNSPFKQNDPYDRLESGPRDLARLVIDISKKVAHHENIKEATDEVLGLDPAAYSLSQKVSNFFANKSLPNTEEFKKIKSIYHGRNINYNSFSIARNKETGLIEVSGTDETGKVFVLPETTGMVIPTIPPYVFVGPNSKNDKLPSKNVEDYFAYFHDYSYKSGFFNRKGDLAFISRLSQNLDRVRPEHLKFVNSTIIYFSTISLNLSMFVQQPDDDIFSELTDVPKDDPEYSTLRSDFYQVLDEELTSYTKSNGFFETYKDTALKDLINNLEITLS